MKKRWFMASICIALCLGSSMASAAQETSTLLQEGDLQALEPKWEWQKDYNGWKYINDRGTYKRNTWQKINGFWYYFDNDGYMATDWKKIGGIEYCFSESGELEVGWLYHEEEEKWHYYTEDGFAQKGWYQEKDGSWYWFSNKGEMVSSGYKNISGKRYYFFDNGQMAANQYVGLAYMDENGIRNRDRDIAIQGKKDSYTITPEVKEAFTEASKNIPRYWVKKFVDQGWQVLYYPNKKYFSAPVTGSGVYYVCHKLDTNYKKIKICNPSDLTEAFGEYIGYASGCYDRNSTAAIDLVMNRDSVDEFVYIPDYFEDDLVFYFGKLVGAYAGSPSTRSEMQKEAPEVTEILNNILYGQAKKE